MRVAFVHDWLTGMRGGEKCLRSFLRMYPDADVYTLVHVPGATDISIDSRVRGTSWLQMLPAVKHYYRVLLPLFPLAARSLKLKGYDLIVSLSHAAAKNIEVEDNAFHVCYCFTPMRYIWDQADHYFGRLLPLMWPLIAALRRWDVEGSRGVDQFAAISSFVAARLRCFYGRSAEVIHPPVDTSWITPAKPGSCGSFFLSAGALVPYKKPALLVEAFNRLRLPLFIAGTGPEEGRLRKMAGPTIHFLGRVDDRQLAGLYRQCRALVFPGKEDFGLVPVECLAAGRPVIGLHAGGLKESLSGLKHWRSRSIDASRATGVFIEERSDNQLQAVIDAVEYFLKVESAFEANTCVQRAALFSPERFYRSWNRMLTKRGLPAVELSGLVEADAEEETTAV